MAQTRDDAKVGGWFAGSYSCVSMDDALKARFRARLALCPHADTCPGCPLLDLSYPEQRELVQSELSAYPDLATLTPAPCQPAPSAFGYRTRAKLVASGPVLGLYERGTHQLRDIPNCRVLDPQVAKVVAALRDLLPAEPRLAGVDVSRAGGQLLVTLIALEESAEGELAALAEQLRARCPDVAGIARTRRAPDAVQLLAAGHTLLLGDGQVRAQTLAAGPYHYVALGAFVQAHEAVARSLYQALLARVFAGPLAQPRVLELYAGSGSLALLLAARGAQVVAVESYAPACDRLLRAAREQDLAVRVLHGDAAEKLGLLSQEGVGFDLVLVNPPRRGLAPEVRRRVAALGPSALGYVSCRPSTLARDLAHFSQLGLRVASATPFDMMPMTDQVETLVWLEPGAPPPLVVRAEQGDLLVLEKPPFVSTVDLLARVRERPGYQSALPRLPLSPEASGLLSFARTLAPEAEIASAQEPHTFLVLAKGILRARGKLRGQAGCELRYVRERVVAGHSLVRVLATDEHSVRRALRAISHPVLGDARSDRESARYFALRHGLDRPFLHLAELGNLGAAAPPLRSELAPDLVAVLQSLAQRTGAADPLTGA
jgi:23S rRNA (uracil1939-C5)-methyltransferase